MVQSILIIKQLNNSAAMMTELFKTILGLANFEIENKVQVCFVDIMIQLIDEERDVPREVADIIFEQLQQKSQTAYRMAVELCKSTSEVLQRYICQHFSDILMEAKSSDDEQDYEQLKEAHELIQEIHKTVPDVLLSVIPQLEEETKVEDVHVRALGTKTLGIMFAERNSFVAQNYPLLIVVYLKACLEQKLIDPEEKVRAAVCKTLRQLELDVVKSHIPKSTLEKVSLRCKDKKPLVQQEALGTLGFIFDQAYDEILLGNSDCKQLFYWIPTAIFNCIYADDSHLTCSIEKAMVDHIIPANENSIEYSKRMLLVLLSLDERATVAFEALMQRQCVSVSVIRRIVEACRTSNNSDNITNTNMEILIKSVASKLPEPIRVTNNLRRFCDLNDEVLLDCLEAQLNSEFDINICQEESNKFLDRLDQILPGSSDTFKVLLRRMSLFLFDKGSISYLLRLETSSAMEIDGEAFDLISGSAKLLKLISSNFPSILRDQLDNILSSVMKDMNTNLPLAEKNLGLLSELSKRFPNTLFLEDDAADKLHSTANNGSPTQVEHAAIILTNAANGDSICASLMNTICVDLKSNGSRLQTQLIVLGQIAAYTTSYFDAWDQKIADVLIEDIINESDNVSTDEANPVWLELDSLTEKSKNKLVALAVLVNRLKKLATTTNNIPSFTGKVFSLLWRLLEEPEPPASIVVSQTIGSRLGAWAQLRLASALAITMLSQFDSYSQLTSVKNFERLALVLQDSAYQARAVFSEMIIRDLQSGALHPRYYAILFLLAHEPEKDLLRQTKSFLKKHAAVNHGSVTQKSYIEMSLVQLVHLLANHPDFGEDDDEIRLFIPFIDLFLSCVATSENVSFLYHIAQKIKATTDVTNPETSKNSYILSDLTCALIRQKCKTSSWSLTSYPGRVKLYAELYKTLPTTEQQTENMRSTYMSATVLKDKENVDVSNVTKEKTSKLGSTKRQRKDTDQSELTKKLKSTAISRRAMPSREAKQSARAIVDEDSDDEQSDY
ncbi:Sister chromatid cohesion protein pds5 [Umbelopsis sp. WA50703]